MASELVCKRKWADGLKNRAALIPEGEPGDKRTLTDFDLDKEVNKFASVFKKLGVRRGDRVEMYLPMMPELT